MNIYYPINERFKLPDEAGVRIDQCAHYNETFFADGDNPGKSDNKKSGKWYTQVAKQENSHAQLKLFHAFGLLPGIKTLEIGDESDYC